MGTYDDFFKALKVQEREARRDARRWFCFDADEYTVHAMLDSDVLERATLEEAKDKGKHLGGQYYARVHPTHAPSGQKHVHVYGRSGQLFAMNVDGTAHDKSHQYPIPNKVVDGLRKLFKDFEIPPNNCIEWLENDATKLLLD